MDNFCCFSHIIGCPHKDGIAKPLFDYEKLILDELFKETGSFQDKHLWIKKSTGLGITEMCLRLMAWLCLKDDILAGSQMVIVIGPNIDIAIQETRNNISLGLKKYWRQLHHQNNIQLQ